MAWRNNISTLGSLLRQVTHEASQLTSQLAGLNLGNPANASIRSITSLSSLVSNQTAFRSAGCTVQPRTVHTSTLTADNEVPTSTAPPQSTLNPLQQVPTSFLPTADNPIVIKPRMPEARAILRNVAISPRKLNDFARILPGLGLEDALIQCQAQHKKSARICAGVLQSAAANAVNNHGLERSKLAVTEAWVGKGQYLKRLSMHAKGRSGVRHKYHAHLTVVLSEMAADVKRKTKVLPMVMERTKWVGLREKDGVPVFN